MTHLFTTIGRAALVALGLAVAPAAFAQQTSATCSGNFNTPVLTGGGYACTFACPANYTASVNGSTVTCTPNGGGDVAPSGCKLTASPTSGGPSATNVNLTLSCTSGTLPISVAWSGSAPGNCPSSMTALSMPSCTVPSVSQTTTWTVSKFSNPAGDGVNNGAMQVTFNYNAGGGGGSTPDWSTCPSGSMTISPGFGKYQASNGTVLYPGAGQNVSLAMWVPSSGYSTTAKRADWSGYLVGGGWYWSISEVACDWQGASAVTAVDWMGNVPANPSPLKGYAPTGSAALYYRVNGNLSPGKMYYFNIYAPSGAGIIGTLPKVTN